MSEQRQSVLASHPFGRAQFSARLGLLAAPVAALLYPFILEAFHASLAPLIGGEPGARGVRLFGAIVALLAAFAVPVIGLLEAMRLSTLAEPTPAERRTHGIALLSVATPPLFVFLGVVLYMLYDPIPDTWIWVAFWAGTTAVAAFSNNQVAAPAITRAAPAALRVAHGFSALAIVVLFLALHISNHATFILGPDSYRAVMKTFRHVYRQDVIQPLVVALFLFQVGSGVYLARRASSAPADRFRTFQIASGVFLSAYILGHMNSVFVFGRLWLGVDTGWGFATGAPAGLIKDAWNIRLVPHYGLGIFFALSHLAAGVRGILLHHGARRRLADRFVIGTGVAAGALAFVIMLGMCGGRFGFALP